MKNWRAWVLAFIVTIIIIWIVKGSHTFQDCIREHRQEYTSQNFQERISNFFRSASVRKDCVGEFIHKNGEAITAAFTVVLAFSTIFLWIATRGLYDAGERQIKTSRKIAALQARQTRASINLSEQSSERQKRETEILQRARLAVEMAGIARLTDPQKCHPRIDIRNVGNLPARHVKWIIKHQVSMNDRLETFPVDASEGNGDVTMPPGMKMRQGGLIIYVSDEELKKEAGRYLYVWGGVFYEDGFGNDRQTLFCHRYNCANLKAVWQPPGMGGAPRLLGHKISRRFGRYNRWGNDAT